MLDGDVPILFGDSQPLVRGLHVAADVHARSACRGAQLIDDKLANSHLRIIACPDKESAKGLVSRQPRNELIGYGGKCIVSAKPLVQRGALLSRSGPSGSNAR